MMLILKKYLTGAGVIALAFSYNISQANSATCFTPPTCAELGYTANLTSCNMSTYIVCPLDENKVQCPDCSRSSYYLTKEQCNSAYGTCLSCPFDNTRYKYTSCNSPRIKSNEVCICDPSIYVSKNIEDDARNTCTDARGTWSSGTGCWTNAKVVSGDACVRVKLNVGDIFTWGGAPLGLVINDDGVNITIAGMFYIDNGATETGDSSGFNPDTMSGTSAADIVHNVTGYIPSVCTILDGGPLIAPASYREGSQYDPICQSSGDGKWRLPNATEAMKMKNYSTPGTLGYAFMNSGSSVGTATWGDYVFYKLGNSTSNMNKWFPSRTPSNWDDITMLDTEPKCSFYVDALHIVPQSRNGATMCDIDGDGDYDVKSQYTYSSISTGRFPVRPVMTIAIR